MRACHAHRRPREFPPEGVPLESRRRVLRLRGALGGECDELPRFERWLAYQERPVAALSSVATAERTERLRALLESHSARVCLAPDSGLSNRCRQPERVGADRLYAAAGAAALFGWSCVVVDAGTALTVDALSVDGTAPPSGRTIAPGPRLRGRRGGAPPDPRVERALGAARSARSPRTRSGRHRGGARSAPSAWWRSRQRQGRGGPGRRGAREFLLGARLHRAASRSCRIVHRGCSTRPARSRSTARVVSGDIRARELTAGGRGRSALGARGQGARGVQRLSVASRASRGVRAPRARDGDGAPSTRRSWWWSPPRGSSCTALARRARRARNVSSIATEEDGTGIEELAEARPAGARARLRVSS
jgi:hypothetical protein